MELGFVKCNRANTSRSESSRPSASQAGPTEHAWQTWWAVAFQTGLLGYQRWICCLRKWQTIFKANSSCLKNYAEATRRLSLAITRTHHKRDCTSAWPSPLSPQIGKMPLYRRKVGDIPFSSEKSTAQAQMTMLSTPGKGWIPERRFEFISPIWVCAYVYTRRATGCGTAFI